MAVAARPGITGRKRPPLTGPFLPDNRPVRNVRFRDSRAGEVLVHLESEDAFIKGTGAWQVRDVQRDVTKPGKHWPIVQFPVLPAVIGRSRGQAV